MIGNKISYLILSMVDSLDFGKPKWRVSMGFLIDRVHEAMNTSLMQKIYSGKVNIQS